MPTLWQWWPTAYWKISVLAIRMVGIVMVGNLKVAEGLNPREIQISLNIVTIVPNVSLITVSHALNFMEIRINTNYRDLLRLKFRQSTLVTILLGDAMEDTISIVLTEKRLKRTRPKLFIMTLKKALIYANSALKNTDLSE